jgi:Tfp pilus assembly ATPase PilU
MQTSRRLGMVTLTDALVELVDSGQVEVFEAYAKAVDKSLILQALKSKGHDTSFAEKATAK